MKLNFDFPLKEISGKIIEEKGQPILMNIIFANSLLSPEVKIGDVVKKHELAKKIYSDKEIEVDQADFTLLKDIAKLPNVLVPLVQAQLLIYLDSVK